MAVDEKMVVGAGVDQELRSLHCERECQKDPAGNVSPFELLGLGHCGQRMVLV